MATTGKKSAAKALFFASSAAFTFGAFGLVAIAFSGGGFEAGLLGAFKFGPILFISFPLILPSLFSGFARPKPGVPRAVHLVLYAIGAAAHAVGMALLAWVLFDGEFRLLGWREAATLFAALIAAAAAWYWLFPERPPALANNRHPQIPTALPESTSKASKRSLFDFERTERTEG